MNVLELSEELGLIPKRMSSTKGGEFHSPCPDPACGGKDRFCVWPNEGSSGRYWCRQCGKSGDAIQFCRDFLGLPYLDACKKVGEEPRPRAELIIRRRLHFEPEEAIFPCEAWMKRGKSFVEECHLRLLKEPIALEILKSRGIHLETAKQFKIGWNPDDLFEEKQSWGLDKEFNGTREKKQWLPKGLVIPFFQDGCLQKIKIRRAAWTPSDTFPKYVEVSGSSKQFAVFGDPTLAVVLVEAEIDAILIQQEASNLCCSVALGGAGKKPDGFIHLLLKTSPRILYSLDFDEAGKKAFSFWSRVYPNLMPWPSPIGKSPEEAHKQGVNLKEWIQAGLLKPSLAYL